MYNITAVIPFCSYDEKFFKPCIDNLLSLGIKCITVTYDHLWGGGKEDIGALERCNELYRGNANYYNLHLRWSEGKKSSYWESFAQYSGTLLVESNWVLYIDIDEIVEPAGMSKWLNRAKYVKYISTNLNHYVYSLSPMFRLNVIIRNTILCRTYYAKSLGFTGKLRTQFHNNDNTWSRWLYKCGLNSKFFRYTGRPFIHHYTHCRDIDTIKIKAANWSHNDFDHIGSLSNYQYIVNNRIGGYRFKVVDDIFNINPPSINEYKTMIITESDRKYYE